MRQLATISDPAAAKTLADHLLAMDVTTRLVDTPNGCVVWVHREDRMEVARSELATFLADPENPRYAGAAKAAEAARREKAKVDRHHARNTKILSGRLNVPSLERCPVTYALIAASVAVALLTGLGKNSQASQILMFAPVTQVVQEHRLDDLTDATLPLGMEDEKVAVRSWKNTGLAPILRGLAPILRGQVWRIITPIFLHFSGLHIVFNMIWLYRLGGLVELRKGSLAMAALVLATGPISNAAEYLWDLQKFGPDHPIQFGGMSGVVYALLGFCWMKSDYDAEADMKLPTGLIVQMILWLFLCMSGVIGPIANAAHVAGLVSGILIGIAPHLRPTWR